MIGMFFEGCTKTEIHHGIGYYAPCWNADGTRIYYFRNDLTVKEIRNFYSKTYEYEKNEWYICSCKPDGSDRKEIAKVLEFEGENPSTGFRRYMSLDVSLSNDILYTLAVSGEEGIWFINRDGARKKKIYDSGRRASYSPDGSKIAYNKKEGGICVIDSNGANHQELFSKGTAPSWSPDGEYILFDSVFWETWGGIWKIGIAGSDTLKLSEEGYDPVWSPDGSKIAYWKGGGKFGIYTNTNNGTSEIKRGEIPSTSWLKWNPGEEILIEASGDVWRMKSDGSEKKKILSSTFPIIE